MYNALDVLSIPTVQSMREHIFSDQNSNTKNCIQNASSADNLFPSCVVGFCFRV